MRRLPILIFGLTISGICIAFAQSTRPEVNDVQAFMRVKLDDSKKVLEGLTVEDFDLIFKNAQAMSLLSEDATWQVLQTPEYAQRSAEFRRAADSLATAAKKKNLDGAAFAYVDLTMKCIDCHQYVRTQRPTKLPDRSRKTSQSGPADGNPYEGVRCSMLLAVTCNS